MKNIAKIFIVLFLLTQVTISAQEKRISFKKGVLKICSSKNFQIEGYDGKEVIIKGLFDSKENIFFTNTYKTLKNLNFQGKVEILSSYSSNDKNRTKGLKKLGKDSNNGLFLRIEQKNNQLIVSDKIRDNIFVMLSDESYKIMIPNTLKLIWDTQRCKEKPEEEFHKEIHFYNSKTSSLSYFKGEVEISTSLKNLKLKDVTGPVSINSLGGNIKIIFDKTSPKKLYSVYTNNGYIDITLSQSSNILIDAKASEIYSNLEFKILEDKEVNDLQEMKLKLNTGRVKMKLNTGIGSIYLRKD